MNWDERAEARFNPGDYATPLATYLGGVNDIRNHVLSDESVERAARSLFYGDIDTDLDVSWATAHEVVRTEYLAMARNALTAAIRGGDE